VSKTILPYPDQGDGTNTPNPNTPNPSPIEIEHALSVLAAEQVAPGVWVAELSIGLKVRITDPAAARPLAALNCWCDCPEDGDAPYCDAGHTTPNGCAHCRARHTPEGLARRLTAREADRRELHEKAALRLFGSVSDDH
jgi:hypothetical protein